MSSVVPLTRQMPTDLLSLHLMLLLMNIPMTGLVPLQIFHSLNCFSDYPCVSQVSERIRTLFSTVEAAHKGKTILLVSHGDTLSILWATVKGLPLGEHRTYGLSTGELRLLHAAASQ